MLGPLEVASSRRRLEIGTGKPAALLALLLVRANEVVSTDQLIEGLWGERPPKSAPKLLQGYVSHLRRALADLPWDENPGGGGLLTRPSGYVLRIEPDQLDAERFRSLVGQARAAIASGDPGAASLIFRQALDLWRGAPLADFAYEAFAQEEITRLEELRLMALEERIEVDLALGRQAELIGELEALIARHPLRERLRAQLMLALYRCDRQSEALQAYHEARQLLVAELGLEPSLGSENSSRPSSGRIRRSTTAGSARRRRNHDRRTVASQRSSVSRGASS